MESNGLLLYMFTYIFVLVFDNAPADASGVLILYRPLDISNDCAQSRKLRYDISFGSGMSDTITLVFRKVAELDYHCEVDIVAASDEKVWLLIVVRFPSSLSDNCATNHNAFTIRRKSDCYYLCDQEFDLTLKNYFLKAALGRFRFGFMSNSSVNVKNANIYQVTATAARMVPDNASCADKNETDCTFQQRKFCFTSGAVCDGIKNCGVTDWFDERKSKCGEPIEKLSSTAAAAVLAALLLAVLACGHLITSCLPQSGNSFFIFNANEDNRLCIDPRQVPRRAGDEKLEEDRNDSIIPVSSSSSSDNAARIDAENIKVAVDLQDLEMEKQPEADSSEVAPKGIRRTTTMRSVTARLLRSVTERLATPPSPPATPPPRSLQERPRRPSIQLL